MNKFEIIDKYKKEDKILIGKLFDKIKSSEEKNIIETTNFLNMPELVLLQDVLNKIKFENFVVYGGVNNAQRNIIIIYPSKLKKVFKENRFDYNTVCKCIRIKNYNDKYEHKVYLGGLIKLGIQREKIGDIIVNGKEADIVVSNEIVDFICFHLKELTRFNKSKIEIIDINDIIEKKLEFKEIIISVASMRLDAIVAELSSISRSKALEILKEEKVWVNYKQELKNTRNINIKDVVTIRGKGKFIVDEIIGVSRSGRKTILVKKYL